MMTDWYRRYPADFIDGTMGMSLEDRGAYSLCLDLIYANGGPIPDNAQWLAGLCGVSTRKWNMIRKNLLTAGKLHSIAGRLSNLRAEDEIRGRAAEKKALSTAGARGAKIRHSKDFGTNSREKNSRTSPENQPASNKNSDLALATLEHNPKQGLSCAETEFSEEKNSRTSPENQPASNKNSDLALATLECSSPARVPARDIDIYNTSRLETHKKDKKEKDKKEKNERADLFEELPDPEALGYVRIGKFSRSEKFVRPGWIPKDPWEGFVEMRNRIKKPMTDYAKWLAAKQLGNLYEAGHDPTAVLENSISHSWMDLYPPRDHRKMNGDFHGQRNYAGRGPDQSGDAADQVLEDLLRRRSEEIQD